MYSSSLPDSYRYVYGTIFALLFCAVHRMISGVTRFWCQHTTSLTYLQPFSFTLMWGLGSHKKIRTRTLDIASLRFPFFAAMSLAMISNRTHAIDMYIQLNS